MKNWNVKKTVISREEMPEHHRLPQSLSWPHLVALGVGAIVGTGILTLIGVGAGKAGPAVILSFAIAGVICACAALAYAEVATMIPASGSAYTYSYVVFGELIAWIIGWSLILEYSLVVSAVAVGWSGYLAPLIGVPEALANGPEAGGLVNIPAIFIIAAPFPPLVSAVIMAPVVVPTAWIWMMVIRRRDADRLGRLTAFAARRSLTNVDIAGISDTTTMPMTISDRLSLTQGMLPNR